MLCTKGEFMKINERVKMVTALLDKHYKTEDKCYLNYNKPYELLFATILSAQCTDERVNFVTSALFQKYTTLQSFAKASIKEMEQDIKSTGFYHNKAKSIVLSANILLKDFKGELPSSIEELTTLPGVGRKTANVVRSHIFNLPSIVVDTHVKRISKKLGLVQNDDPVKIEFELMELLPKEHWIRYNTQIIAHGRKICKARFFNCEICFFKPCCKYYQDFEK